MSQTVICGDPQYREVLFWSNLLKVYLLTWEVSKVTSCHWIDTSNQKPSRQAPHDKHNTIKLGRPIGLILLDVMLPGMTGAEVLESIRE